MVRQNTRKRLFVIEMIDLRVQGVFNRHSWIPSEVFSVCQARGHGH